MTEDARPDVAVGHLRLPVDDVDAAHQFFVSVGMRDVLKRDDFAILELRGGTHLILTPAESPIEPGQRTPFDLMVDDVDAAHARFIAAGATATPIERGKIHDSFSAQGPSGYVVPVNSSHVVGPV